MVSIVPLTTEDGEKLELIHTKCFPDAWDRRGFDLLLKENSTCGWMATSRRGEPIGFILARVLGQEAEILTFAVAPSFQRIGVGRRLLNELLKFLLSVNCGTIFLEVAIDNEAAIALYTSIGFTTVGTRLNYYKRADQSSVSAIIMSYVQNLHTKVVLL